MLGENALTINYSEEEGGQVYLLENTDHPQKSSQTQAVGGKVGRGDSITDPASGCPGAPCSVNPPVTPNLFPSQP